MSMLRKMVVSGALLLSGPSIADEVSDAIKEVQECNPATSNSDACMLLNALLTEKRKLKTHPSKHAAAPDGAVHAPSPATPVNQNRLAIRADAPDNLFYYFPIGGLHSAGQAKGASVSYTDNFYNQNASTGVITHSQATMIGGRATYLLFDSPQQVPEVVGNTASLEWVPDVFVDVSGNWDNPRKKFGDYSAVDFGVEAQFHYRPESSGGVFDDQYFSAAAFGQTDLYSDENAGGAELSWMPTRYAIGLGGMPLEPNPVFNNSLYQGFWIGRADFRTVDVAVPGATLLQTGLYDWLGGTLRSYMFFFPSNKAVGAVDGPWAGYPWLEDRVSLIGTAQLYQDISGRGTTHNYSAELQYNLSGCRPSIAPEDCSQGSSSVSLEYIIGTNPDTLAYTKELLLKLSYKY